MNNSIITVETQEEKEKQLDRMSGMVWVEESPEPRYLPELLNKYTDFFSYIHVRNPDINDTIITLFNTEHQRIDQETRNQFPHLELIGLDAQPLMSNITFFMKRNYSVIVVPRKYGYFCPVINKRFFQGITNCFIGNPEAIEDIKKQTGEFEYGLVTYQTAGMNKTRFTGSSIKAADFETVYRTLE